jgi:peptidoglycan hydrolase CwlO-like protein
MSDPRWPEDPGSDRPDAQDADPTRPLPPPASGSSPGSGDPDPTQQLPSQPSGQPWEAEVPVRSRDAQSDPGNAYANDPYSADPLPVAEESGRGKQIAIGAISALLGFILAFVVIALFTDDDAPVVDDSQLAEAQEQIEELEAEVADRDLQIEELEARLADAEAAIGESDADLEAQREVLNEIAAAQDEREQTLNEREQALNEREQGLDEREAAIADREAEGDSAPTEPEAPPDGDGESDGGLTPPDIDEEEVENIVNRVLERLRDLFN